MKMHCLVSKVPTEYNDKNVMLHMFLAIKKREYLIMFNISTGIWMLMEEINVAEWFRVKYPSLVVAVQRKR